LNNPIAIFNYAVRTYEVSHWGNIAVDDKYQIENIGALLEGEFGRIDYDDYGKNGGKNAIRKLRARLPIRSFGLWYRDEIGNVSTSRAAREVGYYINSIVG
jgi:oligosaccharyltransferase complex subunit alpha (ribophorin I)